MTTVGLDQRHLSFSFSPKAGIKYFSYVYSGLTTIDSRTVSICPHTSSTSAHPRSYVLPGTRLGVRWASRGFCLWTFAFALDPLFATSFSLAPSLEPMSTAIFQSSVAQPAMLDSGAPESANLAIFVGRRGASARARQATTPLPS